MSKRSMSKKMIVTIVGIIVVVLVACGYAIYLYSRHTKSSEALTSNLVVENTGSTNTVGWKLTVRPDGSGTLEYMTDSENKSFSANAFAVKDFANALKNVGTLADLQPTAQVPKSVSFGTSEYAQYQGHKSGDLNASYEKKTKAQKRLREVVMSIVKKAGPKLEPRFQTGTKLK